MRRRSEVRTYVLEEGQFRSIGCQFGEIEVGAYETLLLGCSGKDVPARMHDEAAAVVCELRIGAASIDADHVSLVFDRTRLQQGDPMLDPRDRPVRNHGNHVRAAPDG